MSIRALKLKTGEELVADVEDFSADEILLNKPMSIHMIPSEQGIGLQMLPWAIYLKEHKIRYPSSEVAFCEEPSTSVRNQYAEMTGLPTIPDDSIIIPEGIVPEGIVPEGGPKLSL